MSAVNVVVQEVLAEKASSDSLEVRALLALLEHPAQVEVPVWLVLLEVEDSLDSRAVPVNQARAAGGVIRGNLAHQVPVDLWDLRVQLGPLETRAAQDQLASLARKEPLEVAVSI